MSTHARRQHRISTFTRSVVVTLATGALATGALVLSTAGTASAANPSPPFTECPGYGADTSCGILIDIPTIGAATILTDGTQGPYDGVEDTLVGVINNSSQTINSIPLTGTTDVFGFDGDGICTYGAPCDSNDTSGYGGPISYFTNITNANMSGTVVFDGGLAPGQSTYFSLEEAITGANLTITKSSPTVSTSSTGGAVGGSVSDTATIVGGQTPTGTVTFDLYNNSSCSGASIGTATGNVSGASASSGPVSVSAAGTDYWTATYNGDSLNNSATSGCGEATAVAKATDTITTTPSGGAAGGTVSDSATVTGANPTGTVTFALFSSSPISNCRSVVGSAPGTLSGGTASSGPIHVTSTGTYYWTATYGGDANNSGATSPCGESTSVAKATTTITTSPTTGTAGGSVSDTATVAGASPTGTVVFDLFSNATCSGTPTGTATAPLTTGTAVSGPIPVSAAGTDYWTAAYSGDANNSGVTSACGESTSVAKATGTITTTPTGGTAGGTVSDSAKVTGVSPAGTVSFSLFGPGNPTCTGTAIHTASGTLSGGTASSGPLAVSAAGTYTWVAIYSGDANNNGIIGACGESTTVVKASPAIATTPSSSVPAGGVATDTATLTGASPTGTVVFNLYANANCTGTPAHTSTGVVTGGSASSGNVTVGAAGTYYWVDTYSGDGNNNPATSTCGSETVKVTPQVLTGESYAIGLGVSLLGVPLIGPLLVQSTGAVSTTANSTTGGCLIPLAVLDLVLTGDVCANVTTVAFPGQSTATASTANLVLNVPGIPLVTVQAVQATSTTTCAAGSSGSTTIAFLQVGSTVVISKPTVIAPNTSLNLGVVDLVLNQQIPLTGADKGLTVNAVALNVNAVGVAGVGLIVSSAQSDIGNCP